jgi:hypothetical protein
MRMRNWTKEGSKEQLKDNTIIDVLVSLKKYLTDMTCIRRIKKCLSLMNIFKSTLDP